MAKKKGLRAVVESMSPAEPKRALSRLDSLKDKDPETYEDLIYLIDDFNAGGHTREVFPSAMRFWEFVTGQTGPEKIIDVKYCQFGKYLKERAYAKEIESKKNG